MTQEELIAADQLLREAFDKYRDRPYQVLLAYSGGKDSTFAMQTLREKYGVSVLAMTFDNGFLTERSFENMREATARLQVDSITIRPALSRLAAIFTLAAEKEIFPKKALERASSVCTACIGLVKAAAYREAIDRQIPYICFGWTPGQAPVKSPVLKLDSRMILATQRQIFTPIVQNLGESYQRYFSDPDWLAARSADIPALVYPLVFSRYSEEEIFSSISKLGWRKPGDTDSNSTNCLLNSLANDIHMRSYGFNPYSFEIAGLVREGYLERDEGLERLALSGDGSVVAEVRDKLARYAGQQDTGTGV
jgi:tRNA(Ile)-lysidine synthase TilS/MesJ